MSTSYVSWGAILAGASVSGAISLVLLHFGSAIGLAGIMDNTLTEPVKAGVVVTIGLWLIWVAVISSLAGGYIAGRMRTPAIEATEHEREVRDGIHGGIVWAVATVATIAAASIVGAITAYAPDHGDKIEQAAEILRSQKSATVILAFLSASASLVSSVASWWAATKGGDHRDNAVDLSRHLSFRR